MFMTTLLPVCHILPHADADGASNMATDEALLEAVAHDPSVAYFRTYGWTEPTLSLGYFQTLSEALSDPRWREVALVRRPTGGGAIWHDREITYALAVPRDHPLSRQSKVLYQAVHGAIAALLDETGVSARRRGEAGASDPRTPRPFLCFTDCDAEDLVLGTAKVVGSAQRRRAGAVLQHGSLLLARSPHTPELPGVAELASASDPPRRWAERLASRVPVAIGFRTQAVDWPPDIVRLAASIAENIYRNSSWTSRR